MFTKIEHMPKRNAQRPSERERRGVKSAAGGAINSNNKKPAEKIDAAFPLTLPHPPTTASHSRAVSLSVFHIAL